MSLDPLAVVVLAAVTAERLGELVLARRNTAALLAQGGVEHGAGHYPLIVALHAGWLIGLWWLASGIRPSLGWLGAYLLVETGRAWTLASLGRRWTTRIITVPGETLVRRGPYRIVPHPNYVVVAAEILVLPLAFGLIGFAILFTLLNAAMMIVRIRAEQSALAGPPAGTPRAL